jgi:hypothetical protein
MRDEVWVLPLRGRVVLRFARVSTVELDIETVHFALVPAARPDAASLRAGLLDALGEPPRLAASITRGASGLTASLHNPGTRIVERGTHGGGASISGSGLADSSAAAIR